MCWFALGDARSECAVTGAVTGGQWPWSPGWEVTGLFQGTAPGTGLARWDKHVELPGWGPVPIGHLGYLASEVSPSCPASHPRHSSQGGFWGAPRKGCGQPRESPEQLSELVLTWQSLAQLGTARLGSAPLPQLGGR